jgi:hypothetical protein
VSIGSAIKSASAKFAAEFWRGFEQARTEARARAQSAPLDVAHSLFKSEEQSKATLAALIRAAYDSGVAAEKTRIQAILQAPGAATFPDIAVDLVLGPATAAQAAGVLARAETDAAKRASLLKTSLLESANASAIH